MSARSWRESIIPEGMKHLPKDRRGYPVPVIIAVDRGGTPRFQINDDMKVEMCIHGHLCAICGRPMPENNRWSIGGPLSAFHPNGAYIDTPTHLLCLEYATQVCPYLAYRNYTNRIDLTGVDPAQYGFIYFQDPTQDDDRVPFFVAVNTPSFEVVYPEPQTRYLHLHKPYTAMKFFDDGRELTPAEARLLWWAWQARPERRPEQILPRQQDPFLIYNL